MEKPENKYQRGKIYKLISNQTDDVYYGSTIETVLTNRLSGHRKDYRYWLNGKCGYTSSYEIVKFEDCKIILVENFPCNTKYELTAREQYHIDNNMCVNKKKAPTGLNKLEYSKQYYEENKNKISEKHKQYNEKNKDYIHQRNNQYYESHKDVIHHKNKNYYESNKDFIHNKNKRYNETHKDKISQNSKQYYVDNKEKINQKFSCLCGGKYTKCCKLKHERTQKHKEYLKSLEDNKNII